MLGWSQRGVQNQQDLTCFLFFAWRNLTSGLMLLRSFVKRKIELMFLYLVFEPIWPIWPNSTHLTAFLHQLTVFKHLKPTNGAWLSFKASREAGEPPALCMITSLATAVVEEDLASTKTPSSHAGLWGLAKVWMADVNRLSHFVDRTMSSQWRLPHALALQMLIHRNLEPTLKAQHPQEQHNSTQILELPITIRL